MKIQQVFEYAKRNARRDFRDYGDIASFRADYREIQKDRKACESLAWRFRERELIGVFGRLTITENTIDYVIGQYMPMEIWGAIHNAMLQTLRNDPEVFFPETKG